MTVDAGNLWNAADQGELAAGRPPGARRRRCPRSTATPRTAGSAWRCAPAPSPTTPTTWTRPEFDTEDTYAGLADPKWKGRLCMRDSTEAYTQSLVASLIDLHGREKTLEIVEGWLDNDVDIMSNDILLLEAVDAGTCDVAMVNHYYYARELEENPDLNDEAVLGQPGRRRHHVNISGGGIVKSSDAPKKAQRLLEWLATDGQEAFVGGNHEYPGQPRRGARRRGRDLRRLQADADRRGGLRVAERRGGRPARRGRLRVTRDGGGEPAPARSPPRHGRAAAGGPAGLVAAGAGRGVRRGEPGARRRRRRGLAAGDEAVLPRGLGDMVVTTLLLMAGVGVGTLVVVGGGLAWLVTAYRFPLRDVLVWLLVLPLAMPAYILGFVFLSTFDAAGPVQSALRAVFGDGLVCAVRSLPGAVAGDVAVAVPLRLPDGAGRARRAVAVDVRRRAHARRRAGPGRFWRVLLPLARPSLAAGLALVMMETLTDFATVQYFGVKTVSVGVYLVEGLLRLPRHPASVLVLLFAGGRAGGGAADARPGPLHPARRPRPGAPGARASPGWRGWGPPGCACSRSARASSCRSAGWSPGRCPRRSTTRPASWTPRFGEYLANSLSRRGDRGDRLRAALPGDEPRGPARRRARGAVRGPADHLRVRRARAR